MTAINAAPAAPGGAAPAGGPGRRHQESPAQLDFTVDTLRVEGARLVLSTIITVGAVVLTVLIWAGMGVPQLSCVLLAAAAVSVVVLGWPVLRSAVASGRRGILDQHGLMVLAATAGLVGGIPGALRPGVPGVEFLTATSLIVTCHLASIVLRARLRNRTSEAVRALAPSDPSVARVRRDGHELDLPVEEVTFGDLIRVLPGEPIPVHGQVVDGCSTISQALVTGNAMPEDKVPGDSVVGGCRNLTAPLLVRSTHRAHQSVLAQSGRPDMPAADPVPNAWPMCGRALLFHRRLVAAAAIGAGLFWTIGALMLTGEPHWGRAAITTLSVVMLGYPAALALAGPLTTLAATAAAGRRSVLFRSAEAVDQLAQVDTILLDKTGTLTQAAPFVVAAVPVAGVTQTELLATAAAVEVGCDHPLARAIVDRAAADKLNLPAATDVQQLPGHGMRGRIGDRDIVVGAPADTELGELGRCVDELRAAARTTVMVTTDGTPLGVLGIAAPLKPCAAATVLGLRRAGIDPVLVTGDHGRVALVIGEQAGISRVYAEATPADKAALVGRLQAAGHRVAMIGDGANDAPALRQADVGIAIGCTNALAMDNAGVILTGPKMAALLDAHHIARDHHRRIRQNHGIALALNTVAVLAAAAGLLHPGWLLTALAISVAAVLINALRARVVDFGVWRHFADLAEPARPDPNRIPL